MNSRPQIWGAATAALQNDTHPVIRAMCNAAASAKEVMSFRRAIGAHLKNPTAMLKAIKALKPKQGTQTGNNAQRLAKVLRNANKAPTQRELNSARIDRVFRKSSL